VRHCWAFGANLTRHFRRLIDRLTDHVLDRFADRVKARLAPIQRPFGDCFNLIDVAFLEAAKESAAYWQTNMITATALNSGLDLLTHALSIVKRQGLFLEFGVATGRTISHIAKVTQTQIFGFDSFEGLPEPWRSGYPAGAFAGPAPRVPPNVYLIKGWFSDTLPKFLREHQDPIAFLHIDCDLYTSTKCIFDLVHPRIGPGCVIVFDEYFNYPGWQDHEHKAFRELVSECGFNFRYDSFVPGHAQVCVVIE
jgi:hypothetical protein